MTSAGGESILSKKLLVPAEDIERPIQVMKGHIRTYFEKRYPRSEIIRVQFMGNRCFLQVQKQITEYSSLGRLQFNLVEETTEYDMVLTNRMEIAEA